MPHRVSLILPVLRDSQKYYHHISVKHISFIQGVLTIMKRFYLLFRFLIYKIASSERV